MLVDCFLRLLLVVPITRHDHVTPETQLTGSINWHEVVVGIDHLRLKENGKQKYRNGNAPQQAEVPNIEA